MWNDFVIWFNDKTALLKSWADDTETLIYAILPVAAFVYFIVIVIKKRSGHKKPPEA